MGVGGLGEEFSGLAGRYESFLIGRFYNGKNHALTTNEPGNRAGQLANRAGQLDSCPARFPSYICSTMEKRSHKNHLGVRGLMVPRFARAVLRSGSSGSDLT